MSDRPRTADETITGLRNTAIGGIAAQASIELLIAHRIWLEDPMFQRHLHESRYNGKDFLKPQWYFLLLDIETRNTEQSTSAVKILRIAAALYDFRCPVPLGRALTGLNGHEQKLVLHAVSAAMGHDPTATTP